MDTKSITREWFQKWESGEYKDLPLAENFQHTSPYGTIKGKADYLKLIEANEDKFLGHHFIIHDELYNNDKGCVRYTAVKDNFILEVTEWHIVKNDLIEQIFAYYNIEGDISEDRKLKL